MPVVSVIIPAYNRAHTIERALGSVLAQTFTDYEIIVIDDGSRDNTIELCTAFGDTRIKILRHEENRGAAAARNTGVLAACGEFVAFLDSDDTWSPIKLERQISYLHARDAHCKACCSGYLILDDGIARRYMPRGVDRHRLLLGCDLSPGSTLLVERSVFSRVGLFNERLSRYEDWDWVLRYEQTYVLMVLRLPLATIYYSPKRSAADAERSARIFLQLYDHELKSLRTLGRKARGLRWLEVARYYAIERRPVRFTINLTKAYMIFPFFGPGSILLLLDAWLGTRLALQAEIIINRLRRVINAKSA